jgi:hypothetical protein
MRLPSVAEIRDGIGEPKENTLLRSPVSHPDVKSAIDDKSSVHPICECPQVCGECRCLIVEALVAADLSNNSQWTFDSVRKRQDKNGILVKPWNRVSSDDLRDRVEVNCEFVNVLARDEYESVVDTARPQAFWFACTGYLDCVTQSEGRNAGGLPPKNYLAGEILVAKTVVLYDAVGLGDKCVSSPANLHAIRETVAKLPSQSAPRATWSIPCA